MGHRVSRVSSARAARRAPREPELVASLQQCAACTPDTSVYASAVTSSVTVDADEISVM